MGARRVKLKFVEYVALRPFLIRKKLLNLLYRYRMKTVKLLKVNMLTTGVNIIQILFIA